MPTHYKRTKLAVGDQVQAVVATGTDPVRARITEVKDGGAITALPLTAPVATPVVQEAAPQKGRKKPPPPVVVPPPSPDPVDLSHASVAEENDPFWYAFHPEETLSIPEEGVLSLSYVSSDGKRD